jgi:hypothetical protein
MWAGVLAACTLVAGCGGNPAPKATSSGPSTPPSPPPTIAVSALPGLLLTVDQVNAAMGASGMTVQGGKTYTQMSTGEGTPAECQGLAVPALTPAYEGSGWMAYQGQVLLEPGDHHDHYVDQDVVAFPTADQATAFYKQSVGRWQGCSNRSYTYHSTDPKLSDQTWDVGPLNDSGGMLTSTKAQVGSNGWRCQHALTVANNVAIDVVACAYSEANTFGVALAKQVAANASGSASPGK